MMNNIFKQYRQGSQVQPAQQQQDLQQLYGQFQQDPARNVRSCFKIPENVGNDPNAILNYLTSSGQVTSQQLANARKMQSMLFRGRM